jgi:hypothetical protein
MSIFISIASYQDLLLVSTIFGAYKNADQKENLIFSICDQSDNPIDISSFPFASQIHYDHVDPLLSKGACWARHRIQNFYDNEDYYLQIDSHTQFLPGWDTRFIKELTKIESIQSIDNYHAKPIITSYPRGFKLLDFDKGLFELFTADNRTTLLTYRKDSIFSRGSFSRQVGIPLKDSRISHAFLMAAGCIFTRGHFVNEIPYDPKYYFYGEEQSIALRAFTRGFSFFHIPEVPIFHLYTDVDNPTRKLHWDPEDDKNRATKWHELDKMSLERLDNLFAHKLEGVFGLGDQRTLIDYAGISGIDLQNREILDLEKATQSSYIESLDWKISPLET